VGADPPSEKINANNLMWEFFQEHPAGDEVSIPPGKDHPETEISRVYRFHQNHPNPFNPHTTIRFQLDEEIEVELSIYTLRGEKVRTLLSGIKRPGTHEVTWNGRDDEGMEAASGVYLYRLKAGGSSGLRKMTLVR